MNCRNCWWQEGDLCYVSPENRDENGRSDKKADLLCEQFIGKREMLSKVIPNDKLIILSERCMT